MSIKVTPASVHLVPNIKRQHKSHVHAKAWEWRLHEIAAVSLDGNVLALSVWMPGGDTVRAETCVTRQTHTICGFGLSAICTLV